MTLFDTDSFNKIIIGYSESQKIFILNEKLEIIFNEIFMKIEKWKIFNSKDKQIDMIALRAGYMENQKFLFHLRFFYSEQSKIWKVFYYQVKNHNCDLMFFSKINLKFYQNNCINILFINEKFILSYDEETEKKDFDYHSSLYAETIYKGKNHSKVTNENTYLICSLNEKEGLILIIELQHNILTIFFTEIQNI